MARMRGAEALVQALEKEGVEYVFGLPGHGNMNILDAIYDSSQIEFKLVRHEQAAAHIADGYARTSGKVGVCCSSVGPGAANMIMGIATAFYTSTPLVAISGGIISTRARPPSQRFRAVTISGTRATPRPISTIFLTVSTLSVETTGST